MARGDEGVDDSGGVLPELSVARSTRPIPAWGLRGEMQAEVGLAHRRDGMTRHGMAVDAQDGGRPGSAAKRLPKAKIAAEVWRADDDGDETVTRIHLGQLRGRGRDAVWGGRAVKGGANLVVGDGRAQIFERGEDGRKVCGHPLGRAGAAVSGDADGVGVWGRLQAGLAWAARGRGRRPRRGIASCSRTSVDPVKSSP